MSYELFGNEPVGGKVALVEDEVDATEEMVDGLTEAGMEVAAVESGFDEFVKVIAHTDFDCVSLDWELDGVYRGQSILKAIEQARPACGRLVFSKHAAVANQAIRGGADRFLRKPPGGGVQEYVVAAKECVSLGLTRQIHLLLEITDPGCMAPLPPRSQISQDVERNLYIAGRAKLLSSNRPRETYPDLCEAMTRRGWWAVFDGQRYARLPSVLKLRELVGHSGLSNADVLAILGASSPSLSVILAEQCPSDVTLYSQQLSENEDALLSIFGYFLRRSGYEPEVMPRMLTEPDQSGSVSVAPWGLCGAKDYLIKNGLSALQETVYFVRSW